MAMMSAMSTSQSQSKSNREQMVIACVSVAVAPAFVAVMAMESPPGAPLLAQSTKPRWGWICQADRPLYAEPDGFSPGRDGNGKSTAAVVQDISLPRARGTECWVVGQLRLCCARNVHGGAVIR